MPYRISGLMLTTVFGIMFLLAAQTSYAQLDPSDIDNMTEDTEAVEDKAEDKVKNKEKEVKSKAKSKEKEAKDAAKDAENEINDAIGNSKEEAKDNAKEAEKEAKAAAKEAEKEMKEKLKAEEEKARNEAAAKEAEMKAKMKEEEAKTKSTTASAADKAEETLDPALAEIKFKKAKKAGYAAYESMDYDGAAEQFSNALKVKKHKLKSPKVYEMAFMAGESYHKLRDYKSALDMYSMAAVADTKKLKQPMALYKEALMQKHLGNYSEAMTGFNEYNRKEFKKKQTQALTYKKFAKKEKQGCEEAIAMKDDKTDYRVKILEGGVNSPNNDYAPYYMDDNTMLFTTYTNDKDYNAPTKLMQSTKSGGKWGAAKDIALDDNDGKMRIVNGHYSEETKELFFTKCKMIEGKNICNIFVSKYEGGAWQEPVSVGAQVNSIQHSSKDPMLAKDVEGNTVLYYSSNNSRSRGGYDIFVSKRDENGQFGRPKNMGYPFSTPMDEVSPFFDSKSNTFYFSSTGHSNVGGFDIYSASYTEDEGWVGPTNMGYPVNSSADDYYFSLDKNGRSGFFASNRTGGNSLANETCCDDIYSVSTKELELAVEGMIKYKYEGGEDIVKESDVKLFDTETNTLVKSMARSKSGPYFFVLQEGKDYEIVSEVQNFESVTQTLSTKDLAEDDTIILNFTHTEITDWKNYKVGVIYFEFNSPKLRDDTPEQLESVIAFLDEHEDLVMEVGGHTDNIGGDIYNQRLSEKRAKAVKNYLVSKGIAVKRIITMGYGESKPVVPNETRTGQADAEGQALNRRVEFIIVGTLDEE